MGREKLGLDRRSESANIKIVLPVLYGVGKLCLGLLIDRMSL